MCLESVLALFGVVIDVTLAAVVFAGAMGFAIVDSPAIIDVTAEVDAAADEEAAVEIASIRVDTVGVTGGVDFFAANLE